jgi:hypothetical protein
MKVFTNILPSIFSETDADGNYHISGDLFLLDAVKGTSGSDYVESVVFILCMGGVGLMNYLFFFGADQTFTEGK